MFVVDPVGKPRPYGFHQGARGDVRLYLPPWNGQTQPPAEPSQQGHFDHLEPGTPQFEAAHAFGAVRFVLDVWEGYFGRPVEWHFGRDHDRLEISLFPHFDNAQAGFGFLELGADLGEDGKLQPFSSNFDIIAHEVGHLIIYAAIGIPYPDTEVGEYYGFHESAADLVALLSVLHFDSLVDGLLENSRGNLYTYNRLNRFGELSQNDQIRLASNAVKLSAFAEGWSDEHDLSEPLTGAMFDIFVDVFHEELLDRELISGEVEDLADRLERHPEGADLIQSYFDEAYAENPAGFRRALLDARDYLGVALARTWGRLPPHHLNYIDVGTLLLDVDRKLSGGRYGRIIKKNFGWREIDAVTVGPRLAPPDGRSHAFSARTLTPEDQPARPRLSYRERWRLARQGR
ncbi:MAG: hypothetical protein QNJ30_16640 [Kiloniellales bacterium]|nr:hypothetical protein [Kiloniellales bacterium]